jgi:purine nucleoside permease
LAGLAEEAPQAYKDVDQVVQAVVGGGIARKVARLHPLAQGKKGLTTYRYMVIRISGKTDLRSKS